MLTQVYTHVHNNSEVDLSESRQTVPASVPKVQQGQCTHGLNRQKMLYLQNYEYLINAKQYNLL